ncbi:MAG: sodium-dependent transporter, partial [Lachnospiraceae bacterium]|nr:sodium-dependent transporter [Lachnospiraceae bacterium]
VFSLTLSYKDANCVTRTGMQGLAVYLIPKFDGVTIGKFLQIMLDAMSQIFFSLSVSMGIMITYGVYVPKETDLGKSVEQIELFDLAVALLAGMMVIPAVYVFAGMEGMTQGPGLMFVSLPKVFAAMGSAGNIIGCVFFIMVAFAALTSSVSILETLVASCMEMFNTTRKKTCLILTALSAVASIIICLGYNVLYFEITLPNGSVNQQLLDIIDYISNSFLMPAISFLSCIFVGWIMKPDWIAEEMEQNGHKFRRRKLYNFMIRYMAPISMGVLFLQSAGVLS